MNHDKEKFIVGSRNEEPDQIFFNWDSAAASKFTYLDAFDAQGKVVERYKLVENERGEEVYTTDF
jgi:hypothetical protein